MRTIQIVRYRLDMKKSENESFFINCAAVKYSKFCLCLTLPHTDLLSHFALFLRNPFPQLCGRRVPLSF